MHGQQHVKKNVIIVFLYLKMTDLTSVDAMCFQVGAKLYLFLAAIYSLKLPAMICSHDNYMEDCLRLHAILLFL